MPYDIEDPLAAVKSNGLALEFIHNQTSEICLAAVKQYGGALEHVLDQTEDICITAVKNDTHALRYVRNQTELICLVAIKHAMDYEVYYRKYIWNQIKPNNIAKLYKNNYNSFEEVFNDLDNNLKMLVIFNIDLFK